MDVLSDVLLRAGAYRVEAAGEERGASVDLRVGRGWAALLVPPGVARDEKLAAAGFARPTSGATSLATRSWFRSWSVRDAAPVADVGAAARAALGVGPDMALGVERRPSYQGDPRVPITLVLGSAYLVYAIVVDALVLLAWDVLVPSRAHPSSAIALQVLVPVAACLLFVGYAVAVPRARLSFVSRRRPPTSAEVDLIVPVVTAVGLLLPPVLMGLLLLVTAG